MINLVSNGRTSDAYCIIKTVSEKTNKNGGSFLDMTLCDKTGEINAKLWNYSTTEYGSYSPGDAVKIRGSLTQFNGVDQLRIDKIRPISEYDDFDISSLVPASEYAGERMMEAIYSYLDKVSDKDLRSLTEAMLRDAEGKMLYWPAAFRLHHAMRGGLLYHTLSILRMAESVVKIYPSIDPDLLFCGAIPHDICKIDEFDVNTLGIVKKYSLKGELLGHLVMGAMKISEKAEKLGLKGEKITLLEHMMISHHGTPEFGSPIRPMTLEAIVLSSLDTLDATIYEVEDAVKGVKPGEFTERQWALDNRKLYNTGHEIDTKANLF